MRGQKHQAQALKSGRTIVAERERAETESERMQARKLARRKHKTSILMTLLFLVICGLITYLGGREIMRRNEVVPSDLVGKDEYKISAEVVDEEGSEQLSSRMKAYIAQLEQDFRDLGMQVIRVTLPAGKSREVYVDLGGVETYLKLSVDRATAISAEDAKRALKYLEDHDAHPAYVDLRVEGKAYYQ